jgi:hypothetical protein
MPFEGKGEDHSISKDLRWQSQGRLEAKGHSMAMVLRRQSPFDGKGSFEGKSPSMANDHLWLTQRPFNGKRHFLAKASDGKRPSMAKPEIFESTE